MYTIYIMIYTSLFITLIIIMEFYMICDVVALKRSIKFYRVNDVTS